MGGSSQPALLSAVLLLGLLSLACPLNLTGDSELRLIGPEVPAGMVIYFKSGVSQDQINTFEDDLLTRPHPEGRGKHLAAGVESLLRVRAVEGHEGIAIRFFSKATTEQRRSLREAVKASSVVHKVLQNVAPADVKALN